MMKGAEAAAAQLDRIKNSLAQAALPRKPQLVVVQVGDHSASNAYIRQKSKAAETCGFLFQHLRFPESIAETDLQREVTALALDPKVDGIVVQLPFDSDSLTNDSVQKILHTVPPEKDADGLHTVNQGAIFTGDSTPSDWRSPIPATPLGIYRLLEHYGISARGLDVVVIGKSRLVGFPTATLLSHAGATVTLCHSLTRDLIDKTQGAEIVVVAAGKRHLITPAHLKEGCVVVDVGIHVGENGKLTGDVHPDCAAKCRAISPVPGGVGPMTVASLMENTFRLFLLHEKR